MNEIALFRLITGEDIIAEYHTEMMTNVANLNYLLHSPMKFISRRYPNGQIGILLTPWLPDEIIMPGTTAIVVELRNILAIVPIRSKMEEFYRQYANEQRISMEKNDAVLDGHIDKLIQMYLNIEKDDSFNSDDDEGKMTN